MAKLRSDVSFWIILAQRMDIGRGIMCVLQFDPLPSRCRAKPCLLQAVTAALDMHLQNTCTNSASRSSPGVS